MQRFEKLFIEYNDVLLSQTYSFEKVLQMQSLYSELILESGKLFSQINNKENWLKGEILAIVDKCIIRELPFTEDFNLYYIKYLWRFELISEYLKMK